MAEVGRDIDRFADRAREAAAFAAGFAVLRAVLVRVVPDARPPDFAEAGAPDIVRDMPCTERAAPRIGDCARRLTEPRVNCREEAERCDTTATSFHLDRGAECATERSP